MKTLTQARLVASTSIRNLRDDPLAFALLVGRRFLPGVRGKLANAKSPRLRALGAFLADRPDVARAALLDATTTRRRLDDRLIAKLAVALGEPDAIPLRLRNNTAVLADLAWTRGELSDAVALHGESTALVARRRRSELRILTEQIELNVPLAPRRERTARESPRVLHILTNSLPHTRSGYTARSHAVLKATRAAGATAWAVTRIGYPVTIGKLGVPLAETIDGIEYHRIVAPSLPVEADRRLIAQANALAAEVKQFRPTFLHTTTDFTNAIVTSVVARRYGLPWVYEMRGQLELTWVASLPEHLREAAESSEKVRLIRAREAQLANQADAVVVLSQVQADDLVSRGVPGDKISVVPNSIDPALLLRSTSPAEGRARLGLPVDGVWAGTVSSLVDYEGLDTFLRALALVRADGVDLRGAIVGAGVSKPGLEALAAELGIADSVVFPGRVPATEAVRWHEALDIFVVPRIDTPVCRMVTPLKPVEAMALGRPVAASDLPALREIVGDVDAGVMIAPEDPGEWARALTILAGDVTARERMGQAGEVAAAKRTWQRAAETYMSIYAAEGGAL